MNSGAFCLSDVADDRRDLLVVSADSLSSFLQTFLLGLNTGPRVHGLRAAAGNFPGDGSFYLV